MSKTLGGCTFAWNAIDQDYNIIETLECLYACCDEISIACGGNDGTRDLVQQWKMTKPKNEKLILVIFIGQAEWDAEVGREKLSYFSNMAIKELSTDYTMYVQADEVLTEASFHHIRTAIETDQPAFLITRHNLWATPFNRLNVVQERKPCSTEVIRLAKKGYYCVGDAESLGVDSCNVEYVDKIILYHMGFVRDKYKHLVKIDHMQSKVFLWETDKRIHDNKDGFDPWKWGFTPADVCPIDEPLPKYIQAWAKERYQDPFHLHHWPLMIEWLNMVGIIVPEVDNQEQMIKIVASANQLWRQLSVKE